MNKKRQNFQMCLNTFLKDNLKITCQEHKDLVRSLIGDWFHERQKKIFNNTTSRFRNRLTTRGEPNKSWENSHPKDEISNHACPQLRQPTQTRRSW